MQQTPRGIPVPDQDDPDNVPYFLGRLALFLDPGQLSDYNAAVSAFGSRIVFLLEGDGSPLDLAVPPVLGSMFVDRTRARLWLPFTQLVEGTSTLSWYRLGADADAKLATLTANQLGMTRSSDQIDKTQHADSVAVALTGINAGEQTNVWQVGITFPSPFAEIPVVLAGNGDSLSQPNVVIGVQNVTENGFQVLISRSDVPFQLNDEVTVNYLATATAA